MKKNTFAEMQKIAFMKALKNARGRDRGGIQKDMNPSGFVGLARMYCEEPDCCAREVDIRIKEYDENVSALPVCPICKKGLKTHAVYVVGEKREQIHG
jgi:hypothetical protein